MKRTKLKRLLKSRNDFRYDICRFDFLVDGLTLHLNPAINRLQANIETYNPLTDMIKFKYPRLFENVRLALNDSWPDLIFPESEIAFIVLHLARLKPR